MKREYKDLITAIESHHRDIIAQSNTDPDRWYELYTYSDKDGSETVESEDTFEDIIKHLNKYNLDSISIDIWENREQPKECGIEITSAEGYIITTESYAHTIEIEFESVRIVVVAYDIPDNVWCAINDGLGDSRECGEFDVEGEYNPNSETQTRLKGKWKIVHSFNYNLLARMVLWFNNYGENEGLGKELFFQTYGSVMGDHYYTKWQSTYQRDILKMIGYFGVNSTDGEKFILMIESQMRKYERRISRDE